MSTSRPFNWSTNLIYVVACIIGGCMPTGGGGGSGVANAPSAATQTASTTDVEVISEDGTSVEIVRPMMVTEATDKQDPRQRKLTPSRT